MIPIIFFLLKNENSKNGEVKFFDLIYAFCHSTKFTHTTLNKIEFDGKKYRTTRINDVLRGVLQVDKEFDENNGECMWRADQMGGMLSIHIVRYRFYFHLLFLFGYFHQSNTPPILTTIGKLVKVLWIFQSVDILHRGGISG